MEIKKQKVPIRYPKRVCKTCRRYPCFSGIELCKCDFAKLGCEFYAEPYIDV